VAGRFYYAHRLAFLYMTGEWPPNEVDHLNGIRDDNRWANLRLATVSLNRQNQRRPRRDNTTGYLGVMVNGAGFAARIMVDGKKFNLGTFKTPQEAHEVYLTAKRRLHKGGTL
jgi:hypothetical protein